MKPRFAACLLLTGIVLSPSAVGARSAEMEETITVSFLLAQGRFPSPAEIREWCDQGTRSVQELFQIHHEKLAANDAAREEVPVRAWRYAFGETPQALSHTPASVNRDLWYKQVEDLLDRLARDQEASRAVVHRAYQRVLRRDAYPVELAYWKEHGPLPYALLVGCIEDWARRNQPGLMATSGTPTISVTSRWLAPVRISPSVAAEARAAANLPTAEPPFRSPAFGRNLVAPGGDRILTHGRMFLAAIGREDAFPNRMETPEMSASRPSP